MLWLFLGQRSKEHLLVVRLSQPRYNLLPAIEEPQIHDLVINEEVTR